MATRDSTGESMQVSEKNFLERIAAHLPGIAGYREREARRETDRRLRDFLARSLEGACADLDLVRLSLTRSGAFDLLDEVGRLDRGLRGLTSSLRYADAGYSGLFDQLKVREEELDRMYAYDLSLVDEVEALADGARSLAAGPAGAGAEGIAQMTVQEMRLKDLLAQRREIFEAPGPPQE